MNRGSVALMLMLYLCSDLARIFNPSAKASWVVSNCQIRVIRQLPSQHPLKSYLPWCYTSKLDYIVIQVVHQTIQVLHHLQRHRLQLFAESFRDHQVKCVSHTPATPLIMRRIRRIRSTPGNEATLKHMAHAFIGMQLRQCACEVWYGPSHTIQVLP